MRDVPVKVVNVWKKFHRGELHDSLRDLVPALVQRLASRGRRRDELTDGDFWAVKDVSFQVKRGEALGIIGPNGAGKTTMLKLLTRILRSTRGRCHVHGRVGAMIEVGAAFHPDLSGRENVYLQGVIMGMKRAHIARKLDEIVEFAGLRDFIDTPVKRYSSGMNARLGFSIAAHLDPDVLVIDEVLSVGDMSFQQKCVERMREFKRQGVAIVFVSHNLQAVVNLCEMGLYLDRTVRRYGTAPEAVTTYLHSLPQARTLVERAELELIGAQLTAAGGLAPSTVRPGAPLTLRLTCRARKAIRDVSFGFILHRSTDWLTVFDANVHGREIGLDALGEGETVVVDFAFRAHLTRGSYQLACHVFHNPTQRHLSMIDAAGRLTVEEMATLAGVADLELHPTLAERRPGQRTSDTSLAAPESGSVERAGRMH